MHFLSQRGVSVHMSKTSPNDCMLGFAWSTIDFPLFSLVQAALLTPDFGSGHLQKSVLMHDLVAEHPSENTCTMATQQRMIYYVLASLNSKTAPIGTNRVNQAGVGASYGYFASETANTPDLPPSHPHEKSFYDLLLLEPSVRKQGKKQPPMQETPPFSAQPESRSSSSTGAGRASRSGRGPSGRSSFRRRHRP